jgi:TolA-binding protein
MKSFSMHLLVLLCLLGGILPCGAQPDRRDSLIGRNAGNSYTSPSENQVSGSKFGYFLKADRETPEEQLRYAKELLDAGKRKKASKAYRATVKIWPETREAALAQFEYAKLTEELQSPTRAAENYEYLFTYYTGSFPHEEALQRLFNLGTDLLEHRKGKFFFFRGFKAPERSIPIFENVIRFGPRWERSSEAQFLIGRALQDTFSYEKAIAAYELVQIRYRDTEWAEEASFYKAQSLNKIAQESPNSDQALEDAWIGTIMFQQRHPDSLHNPEIAAYREALLNRRAEIAFEKARYYDDIARRPVAALRAYEEFIKKFPSSEWTKQAKLRIEALEKAAL